MSEAEASADEIMAVMLSAGSHEQMMERIGELAVAGRLDARYRGLLASGLMARRRAEAERVAMEYHAIIVEALKRDFDLEERVIERGEVRFQYCLLAGEAVIGMELRPGEEGRIRRQMVAAPAVMVMAELMEAMDESKA